MSSAPGKRSGGSKPSTNSTERNVSSSGHSNQRNGKSHSGKGNQDFNKKRPHKERENEDTLRKKAKATAEAQRDARHELVVKCNKMWNDLRSKEMDDAKREALVTDIFKLLKGKILSFAQRPDTSRVLQTLIKFGNAMVKKAILDELHPELVSLSKGKHSAFLVVTLLRYGDEADRSRISAQLRENVRSLSTHANGARVLNYCLYGAPADEPDGYIASKTEQKRFFERFYGPDLVLLSSHVNESSKDPGDFGLKQYLPQDESKRSSTVQYLKRLVLKMAEKALLRFPYAQYLCYQVIANSPREDVVEMIPAVSEAALAMVGTWEGTQAVVRCLLAGDAKDRKKMIKEWKDHVVDLAAHKYGWYLLARTLDSVDDTKLLEKSIIDELAEDKEKLKGLLTQEDGYGRKVFLRICAPAARCEHYFEKFHENFESDPEGLSTSKKDSDVRNAEVFSKMEVPLFTIIQENSGELLKNHRSADVIREAFYRSLPSDGEDGSANRREAMNAIATVAIDCIDDATGHVTLKRIVKDEAEFIESGKQLSESNSFASVLFDALQDKAKSLVNTNRSAFVLETLALHPFTKAKVKKELKGVKLPKDVKGSEALAKALAA